MDGKSLICVHVFWWGFLFSKENNSVDFLSKRIYMLPTCPKKKNAWHSIYMPGFRTLPATSINIYLLCIEVYSAGKIHGADVEISDVH